MIRRPIRCVLLMTLLLSSACYKFHVVPPDSKSATEPMTVRAWGFFWGGWMSPLTIDANNCKSGNLHLVTAKTNLGYVLVGALTLGIAVPLDLEWTCAPFPIADRGPSPNPSVPDIH